MSILHDAKMHDFTLMYSRKQTIINENKSLYRHVLLIWLCITANSRPNSRQPIITEESILNPSTLCLNLGTYTQRNNLASYHWQSKLLLSSLFCFQSCLSASQWLLFTSRGLHNYIISQTISAVYQKPHQHIPISRGWGQATCFHKLLYW